MFCWKPIKLNEKRNTSWQTFWPSFTLWALNIPYKNLFAGRLVNWKLWRRLPSNWGLVANLGITANYGGQEKLVSSLFFLPLFSFPSSECFFPQKPISLHTKIWEQRRYLSLSPHTSEKWSKHGGEKKVDEKSFFFFLMEFCKGFCSCLFPHSVSVSVIT